MSSYKCLLHLRPKPYLGVVGHPRRTLQRHQEKSAKGVQRNKIVVSPNSTWGLVRDPKRRRKFNNQHYQGKSTPSDVIRHRQQSYHQPLKSAASHHTRSVCLSEPRAGGAKPMERRSQRQIRPKEDDASEVKKSRRRGQNPVPPTWSSSPPSLSRLLV